MSRVTEYFSKITLTTLCIHTLLLSLYLYQLLWNPPLRLFTLQTHAILVHHQYYRIVTSALFHASFLHIFMNLMSFHAIATDLEHHFGTLWLFLTIVWSILLTSLLYILVATISYNVFDIDDLFVSHSIGFSGVIFHLSVLQCHLHPHATRDVYGILQIPSYLYPWALLVLLQLFLPHLSFMGHLAGIICGTTQRYRLWDVLLPSMEFLKQWEEWQVLQPITSLAMFRPVPNEIYTLETETWRHTRTGIWLGGAIRDVTHWICALTRDKLSRLQDVILKMSRIYNDNVWLDGDDMEMLGLVEEGAERVESTYV